MLTKEEILNTLKNDIDKDKFNIKSLGLFGSYAKDVQNETSDIDILYDFKTNENTLRLFFELKELLEKKFNRKVDLVSGDFMNPIKFAILEEEIIYV